MSLYVAICKKCGKAYDMMSCPYCNKKKYGELMLLKDKGKNGGKRNN